MTSECFSAFSWCPNLNSCCCGACSLENGSIIIGVFLASWAVLNIFLRAFIYKFEYYLSSFDLAITALMLFSGVLLLIGICNCSPASIKISLILMLIMMGLFAFMFSLSIVGMVQDEETNWYRETGPFVFLMYSTIILALLIYFFIVVLNYYLS